MHRLRDRIFEEIIQQTENRFLEDQQKDDDAEEEENEKGVDMEVKESSSTEESDEEEMDLEEEKSGAEKLQGAEGDGGEDAADMDSHTPMLNVRISFIITHFVFVVIATVFVQLCFRAQFDLTNLIRNVLVLFIQTHRSYSRDT